MNRAGLPILILIFTSTSGLCRDHMATNSSNEQRNKKALSIFQVVRFPNSICTGTTSYNGTCYTSTECSSKGGTSAGTCASGFGVCCLFVLSCGGSSSQNCTYLVQSSSTTVTSPCGYKICPVSNNICRIRFDFSIFEIASPAFGIASATGDSTTKGSAIGDCVTDSFSITSPGFIGTPVVCGFNTGQHMIVDASSLCHKANFMIGSSTTTTRAWNIKVTQYACGSNTLGGPPGCLQYFEGKTGTIASFNFPTTSTSVPVTAQHLSNQCYQICIRRESGICFICYTPSITTGGPQDSFGLSNPTAAAQEVSQNEACSLDYLVIPGGTTEAIAMSAIPSSLPSAYRICGRYFSPTAGATANAPSVCTRLVPFRLTFKTDSNEVTTTTGAANTDELSLLPSGTVGFSLNYVQGNC